MIRILFLGQKPLAESCFRVLRGTKSKAVRVCGVVTNKATEGWWGSNAIYRWAKKAGVFFISNERRNHRRLKDVIKKYRIDTLISVQHSWILPPDILSLVHGFAFNLHNAKLPDYKGFNTITHALLNGEKTYTTTLHWMVPEVDMGPVAFEKSVLVEKDETAQSLYKKSQKAAIKIFKKFLSCLIHGDAVPRHPLKSHGTFYSREDAEKCKEIKSLSDINEVDVKARAFYFPPFEPAFFLFNKKKFYVLPESAFRKKGKERSFSI